MQQSQSTTPWPGIALGLVLAIVSAAAANAACPTSVFFADLALPLTGTYGTPASTVTVVPGTLAKVAPCPFSEVVLELNIPTGCTTVIANVEFEGPPKGWQLDLGNSPTNDGFAGDANSTGGANAELWILEGNGLNTLSIANGGTTPAVIDNPLVSQSVSLLDSSLKFVVKNQFVSWGQPHELVQTPASKNLFRFPHPGAAPNALWLGLNRVIANNSRNGCGARSVWVRFE